MSANPRVLLGVFIEGSAPESDTPCCWEDCDQDAVYCAGHALEFANVPTEKHALQCRDAITAYRRVLADILRTYVDPEDDALRTTVKEVLAAYKDLNV